MATLWSQFAKRTLLACFYLLAFVHGSAPAGQNSDSAQTAGAGAQHHIKTVFVIVMENHNWTGNPPDDIKGNPAAPYINSTLLPMASYADNYNNPAGNHPSLPNYLWMEAGTNFGIRDDGPPSQHHQSTQNHLVRLLENAGISWKAYDENISGTSCPLTNGGPVDPDGNPRYAVRHDPFVYFDDQTNTMNPKSTDCISHIRPFSQLATDLAKGKPARYNFITPNLCDDMHDSCSGDAIAHGDGWLKRNVPTILNSTAYRTGGALFITWDEAAKGDGPIPMIVLSPFAKGNQYSNNIHYTHSSLLRTLQEIFGVFPLLGDAANQPNLSDLFHEYP
jgi:hypothetical protein